jgi:predicted phage terminase large subunit-like protein
LGEPNLEPPSVIKLGPQEGPQAAFVGCPADIAIYGGAAGGGKSYGLLLDPLSHYDNPDFGAVIFRKTAVEVRNEGGLWDESMRLYSLFGARPREHALNWRFPSSMSVSFGNLEYEKDVLNWQGSQIAFIGFDELTHFSRQQFFYMLSRNRSMCGVKPYVRATCNPDPDSWVKEFIRWWLDAEGRYADPAKSGVLRYFVRLNDQIIWADSAKDLHDQYGYGPEIQPKSVTFIPSRLEDNKILMQSNPGYMANLLALNRVDRARLRDGDWLARVSAGSLFKREWFKVVDAVPSGWIQAVRMWDRAATKPHEHNKDPDWTRGLKLYKYADGRFCVVDLVSARDTPGQIEQLIKTVAGNDTVSVKVMSQQDPGSAGVLEAENFTRMLQGYYVSTFTTSKDKITRAKPVSAQCEAGNILVLRAGWNNDFFAELENFPDGVHDDQVDVLSGAFNELAGGMSLADVL